MSDRHPPTKREILEQLFAAFEEADAEDDATLQAALVEAGLDPDALVRDGLAFVKNLSKQQRLREARQQWERLQAKIHELRSAAARSAEEVRSEIAKTLAGEPGGARVQAYYRKLESIDPADLANLEDDVALLDLLDRLKGEGGDG